MPYYMIEDFKYGLDLRKSPVTAPSGTLRKLSNGNITPGGEIEKAKKWTPVTGLPAVATFGLHGIGDRLFTFGSDTLVGIGGNSLLGNGLVEYQTLTAAGSFANMVAVLDVETFDGRPYVIAEFDNGAVHHFYDGVRIEDWDTLGGSNRRSASLLGKKVENGTPGTAVSQLEVAVFNNKIRVTGAPGESLAITPTVSGSASALLTATQLQLAMGPLPSVWEITVGGTFSGLSLYELAFSYGNFPNNEEWDITLDARLAGTARAVKTLGNKLYAVSGSFLYWSGFNADGTPNPIDWTDGIGAGFENLSTQSGGAVDLIGLGVYQEKLVVFSERDTQVWAVFADPDENIRTQDMDNIGALAAGSVVSFGDIDLFFLSATGVRSLRARDAGNLSSAQDVGSAVDGPILAAMANTPEVFRARATVNPENGRYLLSLGDTIFVFSHFPGASVSGWSTYDVLPQVSGFARIGQRLYARSGDTVYVYGGPDGTEYPDDVQTEVQLPFLSADTPGTQKTLRGLDIGCEGTWDIYLHPDPSEPELSELLGTVEGTTYGFQPRFVIGGQTTHFSLRFVHTGPGYARLSNVAIHYDTGVAG